MTFKVTMWHIKALSGSQSFNDNRSTFYEHFITHTALHLLKDFYHLEVSFDLLPEEQICSRFLPTSCGCHLQVLILAPFVFV